MPRALAMMVGIPLVGRLYNRVQPRILVIIGVVLVALSAYVMSHYTLETSARSVVGAIVLQGFGLRVAVRAADRRSRWRSIPRYRLTDATGLNSLLRQIGGSLGLAAFATLLPHFIAAARTGLAAHVAAGPPRDDRPARRRSQARLIARGLDPAARRAGAARILDGMVSAAGDACWRSSACSCSPGSPSCSSFRWRCFLAPAEGLARAKLDDLH